jgi:hypothetical protein
MRRLLPVLLLSALPGSVCAQVVVQGRVVDGRTREPLAFVHVVPANVRQGTTSDIDGRFALTVPALPAKLWFSYVGYAPLELVADRGDLGVVRLERSAIALREAEVRPGENPAHRIIARVYANRRANDALRNRAYRYTSYSKTVFTAALDSAVLNDPEKLAALDSSDRKAVDWLDKQHLLLIESATRMKFIPPAAEQEEVLALRVSGLKDPSMLALAASTKTFSIYAPQIEIGEKTYLSPIGPNSTDRYLFDLKDTLYQGADTVFVIAYQPRHGRRFDALKGALWVNTDGYALQNVIAEPVEREGGASVKLQQQFQRVQGAWFPVQLNTFLFLDFVQVNRFKVMGVGRSYLKDIEVDAPLTRRDVRGAELVMDRMAIRRDDGYWAELRTDTLSARELRTYRTIDSVSQAEGLERKLKWLDRLSTGRLPLGPVDLRLDQLLHYNGYEGLRAGLGAGTNDKLWRFASVGGYAAYGFGDAAWKYGGDVVVKPRPGIGPELKGYYAEDVAESGGVAFPWHRPSLSSTEGYRWVYVDRMDRVQRIGGELAWRPSSALKLWLGSERTFLRNAIGYQLAEPVADGVTLLSDAFVLGVASAGARYAPREQLVRLPDRQYILPSKWPVLHVRAQQAVQGLWEGDRSLWRIDLMVEQRLRLRMAGELGLRLMAGIADPLAPYAWLFNLRGSFSTRVPVATAGTFETMRPNEFLADRYVALHARHSFGHLLAGGKRFKPVPVAVANAAWGALEHPERHRGYTATAFRGGYYEAGVQVDNLLVSGITGIGVGAYWRFGPLALPEALDNLAVKATIGFAMGR